MNLETNHVLWKPWSPQENRSCPRRITFAPGNRKRWRTAANLRLQINASSALAAYSRSNAIDVSMLSTALDELLFLNVKVFYNNTERQYNPSSQIKVVLIHQCLALKQLEIQWYYPRLSLQRSITTYKGNLLVLNETKL